MAGSHEERESGRRGHKVGRQPREGEWRIQMLRQQATGCRGLWQHQKAERGKKDPPRGSAFGPAPWFWTCGLQNSEIVDFCSSNPPSLWSFMTAAPRAEYGVVVKSVKYWSWRQQRKPSGLTSVHAAWASWWLRSQEIQCQWPCSQSANLLLLQIGKLRHKEVKPFVWESSPSCWRNLLFFFVSCHPTYMHTHIHIQTHTNIHIHKHRHTYIHTHMHTHMHIHPSIHSCIHMCTSMNPHTPPGSPKDWAVSLSSAGIFRYSMFSISVLFHPGVPSCHPLTLGCRTWLLPLGKLGLERYELHLSQHPN